MTDLFEILKTFLESRNHDDEPISEIDYETEFKRMVKALLSVRCRTYGHRLITNNELGDPGTGKSTLSKYLALAYLGKFELNKENSQKNVVETIILEQRIPFIIPVRDYMQIRRVRSNEYS